ncbi:hypothetical protein [Halocatena halophila]|uniref:hypothetical protein n=1 Tax=Halocatena halophila TaxID=2814576 RepID=UPI002ECFF0FA
MDPITTGLGTNLLAAGLLNQGKKRYQQFQAVCRKADFHAEIDAIETEFHNSLRTAIEECTTAHELDDLADIGDHWETVIERLELSAGADDEADRLVFTSEQEAINRVAQEIGTVCRYDLETNPQLEQALKRAVTEAYKEAVGSFGERLVDAGLDQQFVAEANIEELAAIDALQDRLAEMHDRLSHPRLYELYHGNAAGRRQASQMIDPQALEFVSRPELDDNRDVQRLLVLGPGGSGKSRALAEFVATADQTIEHIIRPKAVLHTVTDLQPLRSESFQGDVLLVWDDIHAISPETGNTVFRKAVFELEEFLSPEHELHVIAAAQSKWVNLLPGNIERADSPLWSGFEIVELGDLTEDSIGTLFDRVVAKEGVVVPERVRTAFVEKAKKTDPSPLYITSVVETVNGMQVTMKDIERLPEDALTIWQEQYEAIKAANDERRFILWAVKLLAEVGHSQLSYHSLLQGIHAHVLDRDELMFESSLEELCRDQWFVPQAETAERTKYTIHDVQIKAIDESVNEHLREYSTFLFETVERFLPDTEGIGHRLHELYVRYLFNRSVIWDPQVLEQHCEWALTLEPECASAHITYANILSETLLSEALDASERAKEHYEEALAINSESSMAHYNYAKLLSEEDSTVEEAKEHYERALAINSESSVVHYNYAKLLEEKLDMPEKAKQHYKQTLALAPEYGVYHCRYGNLLIDELDELEEAKRHYKQALQLFQDESGHRSKLSTLSGLIHVHRVWNNNSMALDYCEHALKVHSANSSDRRWFEGIHALLTETDSRSRYRHGLTAICDDQSDLSRDLFEQVWINRDDHLTGSASTEVVFGAGVMLAALTRMNGDDSQAVEEILSCIEPSVLTPSISILYASLNGESADSVDVSITDEPPADIPALERQVVAHILDHDEH